jgi:hypothetical protein
MPKVMLHLWFDKEAAQSMSSTFLCFPARISLTAFANTLSGEDAIPSRRPSAAAIRPFARLPAREILRSGVDCH